LDEHNVLVEQLNKNWIVAPSAHIGNTSDYLGIASDGTPTLYGAATVFEDDMTELYGARVSAPGSKIAESTNNTLLFSTNCPVSDYAGLNFQTKHAMKTRAALYPHLHWWQDSTKMPNWLIRYRWQYNGKPTNSAWTDVAYTSNAFVWTTGQLNQITAFGSITPTSDAYISDILQIKLTRDSANTSSKFGTTDPYGAPVHAMMFDIHWERDTLGSKTEYIK
jgi:hypothetical protein